MDITLKDKRVWFWYVMKHRNNFCDKGHCAVYLGDRYTILFWRCM